MKKLKHGVFFILFMVTAALLGNLTYRLHTQLTSNDVILMVCGILGVIHQSLTELIQYCDCVIEELGG